MKIADLAEKAGLPFEGDGNLEVRRIRGIDTAEAGDLTFVQGEKFVAMAWASSVLAVVAEPDVELPGKTVIRSDFPQLTLVRLTHWLHPRDAPLPGIDARAVVEADCQVHPSATIHPMAVLAAGVKVGPGTEIFPGAYLGRGASVGGDCVIHANVTIGHGCRLGDRVIVHAGSVLGSDGFGYLQHEGRHVKIPHLGDVVVEDDVEIGGGCSIDRGTYGSTVIGQGSKLDNLVHIAHNVEVGAHAMLMGQVGIAGSSKLGRHVIMAGQSGVLNQITVGDGVVIGPKSVMTRSGREAGVYYGFPARPQREWQRAIAHFYSLDKLVKRINRLLKTTNKDEE